MPTPQFLPAFECSVRIVGGPSTVGPMGWFKRAASAVNTHYDVATELKMALAPSIRRVRKLEEQGTPANGVITGIHFSLKDGTTRKEFAVSVQGDDGWQRFGVRTQPSQAHRLRLGVPVVVKFDGDRGILDWEAMTAAWGLPAHSLPQDAIRTPPDDGIIDTALDARVQRHLKKWTPAPATIVALDRCSVLGMPTLNWDISLQLPDGRTAMSKRDEVPSYAQWYAAPGAVVPAVIDPKDASQASIDWPAFALAQAGEVGFDDDPPPGSAAADIERAREAPPAPAVMGARPAPLTVDPSAPVALDATMRSWVDAFKGGYMKQKAFDKALADWNAAGMCTPAQVEAARAAAQQG